jgi:hypothetical protein
MSAKAPAKPVIEIEIDGAPIRLTAPALLPLLDVQRWLDKQPSPLKQLQPLLDDLPPETPEETRRALVVEAVERSSRWPPRFGSNEANVLLLSLEGAVQLAAALIRTGRPDVALEQALELAGRLSLDDLTRIVDLAFGRLGAAKTDDDPNAETAA